MAFGPSTGTPVKAGRTSLRTDAVLRVAVANAVPDPLEPVAGEAVGEGLGSMSVIATSATSASIRGRRRRRRDGGLAGVEPAEEAGDGVGVIRADGTSPIAHRSY